MTFSTSGFKAARALALFAIAGTTTTLVAGAAHADVPPPPGYVEECTVDLQQHADAVCEACGSYYGTVQKCPTQYASTPFTKRCQTAGASVWTEVWCRPRTSADPAAAGAAPQEAPPVPAPTAAPTSPTSPAAPAAASTSAQDSDSCSVGAVGAAGGARTGAWFIVATLLLAVGARRR